MKIKNTKSTKNTKTKVTDREKYFLDLLAADVEKSFESEDKSGWLRNSRPAKEISEFIRNWEP